MHWHQVQWEGEIVVGHKGEVDREVDGEVAKVIPSYEVSHLLIGECVSE
jgi:hypothetical protein